MVHYERRHLPYIERIKGLQYELRLVYEDRQLNLKQTFKLSLTDFEKYLQFCYQC